MAEIWKTLKEPGTTRFLLGVKSLSSFNAGILIPVLPLYFFSKGFSFAELGSLFSMVALGSVGVQLMVGRYASFFSRSAVLAPLLLTSAIMFPAYLYVDTLPAFALVATISGISSAAAGPGLNVLIASLSTPDQRAFMYSKFGMIVGFNYAGGVMVGGFLLGIGFTEVFYAGFGLSIMAFLIMLRMAWMKNKLANNNRGEKNKGAKVSNPRHHEELSHALRSTMIQIARARAVLLAKKPVPKQSVANIYWIALHLFLFGATLSLFPVYFPRYLIDLGLPIGLVGVVVASSWVVFGIVQPIGARYVDRTGRHRSVLIVSLGCASLLIFLMGLVPLFWIIVAWVVLGAADGIGRPITSALLVNGVPPAARGTAFGWTMAADTMSRIVSPLLLAFIITAEGLAASFIWIAAVVILSISPIFLFQQLPRESPLPSPGSQPSEVTA